MTEHGGGERVSQSRDGPEEHFIVLAGLRMRYLAIGPIGGPPVILLHGFPEAAYAWRGQWRALAEHGYRVIAPDQRGFNLTDKTPPYDLATVVNDVIALMDACHAHRAHLVGHDWGAMVAWTLAAWHPDRVRSLTIVNVPHPAVLLGIVHDLDVRQWFKSWYALALQLPVIPEIVLRAGSFVLLRRVLQATAGVAHITRADLEEYRRGWAQRGALSAMLGWYRALPPLIFRRAARRRFERQIAAPTIVLWGMKDFVLRSALADRSMTWVRNGKLIRFPKGSHWLHEEYPGDVTTHLLRHLEAC